jgi:hypothetical protein
MEKEKGFVRCHPERIVLSNCKKDEQKEKLHWQISHLTVKKQTILIVGVRAMIISQLHRDIETLSWLIAQINNLILCHDIGGPFERINN